MGTVRTSSYARWFGSTCTTLYNSSIPLLTALFLHTYIRCPRRYIRPRPPCYIPLIDSQSITNLVLYSPPSALYVSVSKYCLWSLPLRLLLWCFSLRCGLFFLSLWARCLYRGCEFTGWWSSVVLAVGEWRTACRRLLRSSASGWDKVICTTMRRYLHGGGDAFARAVTVVRSCLVH